MSRDPADNTPLVLVRGLHKRFAGPEGEVHVLKGIDLEVYPGESVAVVGISGAGKSTLLHILGGLEPPSQGEVRIGGQDLSAMSSRDLARFRNRKLGFVFQFHHLLPEFTALENAMMPALISRMKKKEARKRAEAVLGELGLSERLRHKAGELSGGEQQRVAIARAVVLEPSLILADEPTGNLDAATGKTVEDLLLRINREKGITLFVVTHNEKLARRMDRVIRIHDGKVSSVENNHQ